MSDKFCEEARKRFASLMPYWRNIEQWIKRSEQINRRAVIPAINELRYAARQLFYAQIVFAKDVLTDVEKKHVIKRLAIAEQYMTNADHDIVDGVVTFYNGVIDDIEGKYGRSAIIDHYPRFPLLKEKLKECEDLISDARRDYEKRYDNYSLIRNEHFPMLIKEYDFLLDAEVSAQETKNRINRKLEIAEGKANILWWASVTGWIVAVAALIFGYFAWTTTYEEFCKSNN